MFCDRRDKPRIDYPCPWEFRIIGADATAMRAAVREVLGEGERYELSPGKTSPKGRWCSLSLEMRVLNEPHRDEVHRLLREHPDVRMVL
ncbi:MAG TPA: DUF493 domain-containing protein [Sandaracinaceae bacterium LLY-WYZ-13_1]|nr:DUF493 domain-containing protein [Sandaracinaceae bacterium LLY-WYZ-13_1]